MSPQIPLVFATNSGPTTLPTSLAPILQSDVTATVPIVEDATTVTLPSTGIVTGASSSGMSGFNTISTIHISITTTSNITLIPAMATVATTATSGAATNAPTLAIITTISTHVPASISVIVDPVSTIQQLQPPSASNVSDISSWCTDACLIRAGYALTMDSLVVTGLDGQLSSTTFSAVFFPTYQVNALSTVALGCMLSYGTAMEPRTPTLIVLTSDDSADFSSAAASYFSVILATESCGTLPSTLVLERDNVLSTGMSINIDNGTNTSNGGLSTGAKVGIGIAVSVVGLVILGSVIFILIHRRNVSRRRTQSEQPATKEALGNGAAFSSDKLESSTSGKPEKDGVPVSELSPTPRYELDSGPVGSELNADHGMTDFEHRQA